MTTEEMDRLVSYVVTVYNRRGRQIAQLFAETYAEASTFENTHRKLGRRIHFEMLLR